MTKRRRNTLVREDETRDILILAGGGHHQAEIAKMMDRSEATIAKVLAEHRAKERDAEQGEYKAMFKVSARVAAEGGDHRPALEWLDRYGAIPESSKSRTAILQARLAAEGQAAVTSHLRAGAVSGPVVNIGIGLPSQLQAGDSQILYSTVQSRESAQKPALIVAGRVEPSTEGS
jgi:hypothetical protein